MRKIFIGTLLVSASIIAARVLLIAAPLQAAADAPINSQPAAVPEKLPIEKAFELALANNPVLKAREADKSAAHQDVNLARSRFLPQADIREAYVRSDNPVQVFSDKLTQQNFKTTDFEIHRLNYPTLHTNVKTQFILTQPLFNRGREFADYKTASFYEKMSAAAETQARQKVLLDVQRSYLAWLLAIDAHQVLVKTVETAAANVKLTDSRFRAGTVLKSDVLQSQVHLASLQREELAAKNRIAIECSNLNVAMGTAPERQWQAVTPDFTFGSGQKDLAYWSRIALERRPERTYLAMNREAARMGVKKNRMNFLPAVNFKSIYEYDAEGVHGVNGDNVTVMVTAVFNIFNGLGDFAQLKKAKAEELKALAMEKDVEQNIRNEVHKAWLNRATAQEQVAVTEKSVSQAEEGLRIVQQRYMSGLTIITELLNSETALSRARLEHLQALYDFQLACAELKWAAGILHETERTL
jgi:outer membrane protein TolC